MKPTMKYINDITLFSSQSTAVESYHLTDEKRLTGDPLQSVQTIFKARASSLMLAFGKVNQAVGISIIANMSIAIFSKAAALSPTVEAKV
ncbi:MAG: hypothetical protein ACJASB_000782 [Shewanella psychromarinicola]|jgi:hypothetical protein